MYPGELFRNGTYAHPLFHAQDRKWESCRKLSHGDVMQKRTAVGILNTDKLEVDVLQVPGAAVPAIQEPGAEQAG